MSFYSKIDSTGIKCHKKSTTISMPNLHPLDLSEDGSCGIVSSPQTLL